MYGPERPDNFVYVQFSNERIWMDYIDKSARE